MATDWLDFRGMAQAFIFGCGCRLDPKFEGAHGCVPTFGCDNVSANEVEVFILLKLHRSQKRYVTISG